MQAAVRQSVNNQRTSVPQLVVSALQPPASAAVPTRWMVDTPVQEDGITSLLGLCKFSKGLRLKNSMHLAIEP